MKRIIFSGWMGPGPMSEQRQAALLSLVSNSGCAQGHITLPTLGDWIHPAFPLHPAFPFLSAVHQCDYLRCYTLHVYGGGYADVKPTSKNWNPFFQAVEESAAWGAGYQEVGPHGVARVGGHLELEMQENYAKLIGLCAMIFRPQTSFTRAWFESLHSLLDQHLQTLKEHPARHPQDRLGATFSDGSVSHYPLAWTGLGGDLFHPLVYQHSAHILQLDMAPSFKNYR